MYEPRQAKSGVIPTYPEANDPVGAMPPSACDRVAVPLTVSTL
jgi:hypothetical protein